MGGSARKTVLLIDDEPAVRRLIRSTLSPSGYLIIEASNGHAGLELTKVAQPDILVVDVRMPGSMDGFEMIRALHHDRETRNIPVIVLTGADPSEFSNRPHSSKIVTLLTKPFRPHQLIQAVEQAANIASAA